MDLPAGTAHTALPSAAVVAEALARVVASRAFSTSPRHRAFLEAIVGQHLTGPGADALKELTLGVEVFGRDAGTFDPRIDNIVRVEARRLRERLAQYYETEGAADAVIIELPKGGYAPAFTVRSSPHPAPRTSSTTAVISASPVTAPLAGSPGTQGRWPSPLSALLTAGLVALAGLAVMSTARGTGDLAFLTSDPPAATLVVLPLTNLTGDSALDPFVDGLTDDLADALARAPGVRATARTSALVFRAPPRDLRAVGAALAVRHVVEGSVERDGDQVQVRLRLARTSDAREIWTHTFATPIADIFTLRAAAVPALLGAIDPALAAGAALVDQRLPRNPRAREAYVRGQHAVRQSTSDGFAAGVAAFESCIRIEPAFGRCHSGWGHARSALVGAGTTPATRAEVDAIERAIRTAIALEPTNATALANLAGIDALYHYDWPAAKARYLAAVAVSPQLALEAYAGGLTLAGRLSEAEVLFRRALEWDPVSLALRFKLAGVSSARGRSADVLAQLDAIDALAPDHPATLYGRTIELARTGDLDAAQAALTHLVARAPGWQHSDLAQVVVLAARGQRNEALKRLQAFESRTGDAYPYLLGTAYAHVDRPADAARWLLTAIERHDPAAAAIVMDPMLAPLRPRPEFRAVWDAVPRLTTDATYPGGVDASPR